MITLALPVGSIHGWGVCGRYLAREMAGLLADGRVAAPGETVRLMTNNFTPNDVGDELEFQAIAALRLTQQDLAGAQQVDGITRLPGPLLSCIVDKQMIPAAPHVRGTHTVGYTFFEENIFEPAWLENARRYYDVIATGSTWCTEVLRGYGLTNVETVIQGVDPRVFFPWKDEAVPEREFLKDRFVIFSGGKFELRKGQDIVIRAVKVLQERHKDVVLLSAWNNPWQQSIDTMRNSPHLRWQTPVAAGPQFAESMNQFLASNGLDMARVITLGPRPNALMARIYRNTDVGIFPNRCEGGTNLVLMEYMACGKPVVATATTGHADIVRPENALTIGINGEYAVNAGGKTQARWPEPDLDDAVAKLEWAYQDRAALAALGTRAGEDLSRLTWTKSAEMFLNLLLKKA
jgi:glycosyltransferase involved in cell wall biosynthesis